jgi:hypothetical protein
MSPESSQQSPGIGTTVSGWMGIVLYLVLGLLYLTSGLVVPLPGLVVLWLVWVAGWFLVVRLFRARRVWTPIVALAGAVFWWVYLSLGAALFDWTA